MISALYAPALRQEPFCTVMVGTVEYMLCPYCYLTFKLAACVYYWLGRKLNNSLSEGILSGERIL